MARKAVSPATELTEAAEAVESAPEAIEAPVESSPSSRQTADAMVRIRALDHSGPWQYSPYGGEPVGALRICGRFNEKGRKLYEIVDLEGTVVFGPTNTLKACKPELTARLAE